MNTPSASVENPTLFRPFNKMPRLNREVIVTEKIDGTNAQVVIVDRALFNQCVDEHSALGELSPGIATHEHVIAASGDLLMLAASRTRWIRPKNPGEKGDPDNYGFAAWVKANAQELFKLGLGRHYGEWFGSGINRNYGLTEKRFALFNTARWLPSSDVNFPGVYSVDAGGDPVPGPSCCHVVPTVWREDFSKFNAEVMVELLRVNGSFAVPGFKNPEGFVIFHTASQGCYKVTLENDASPKSLLKAPEVL